MQEQSLLATKKDVNLTVKETSNTGTTELINQYNVERILHFMKFCNHWLIKINKNTVIDTIVSITAHYLGHRTVSFG